MAKKKKQPSKAADSASQDKQPKNGAPKKKASGRATPTTTATELQKKLKRVEREIVKQCNERVSLYLQLANISDSQSITDLGKLPIASTNDAAMKSKGPLSTDAVSAILRELDSASQALVHPTKVTFLGPEFSYSHLASIHQFGQSHILIPVSTIAAVFESVERGDADFGIVPIENSTDGRIVDTLEMFVRLPVKICGEIPMPIHHNLLAKCAITDVTEVHSKPQALSKCRDWLAKNLPAARLVPTASTTTAAQLASTEKNVAAIASRQAGSQYGLSVLAAAIEDNKHNVTRFAVIGREPAERTGDDKTSFMFELCHEPGALANTMAIFKRNRLNLTWIESFPKQGSPHEYIFFVELHGHQSDVRVRRAVASLEKKTVKLGILGSYPRKDVMA
ncbi:MAG: prephenate dehydratase [Planctomycetales bacterium]|nr:prephenate dehydratase [Planctomycetales bacterium]